MFFFNGYVFLREEGASLVAQMVKNLPTVPETQVRSLGWEDPLEEEMAPHSSTLAWKIPSPCSPAPNPSQHQSLFH